MATDREQDELFVVSEPSGLMLKSPSEEPKHEHDRYV
jgi:hypothetical protein